LIPSATRARVLASGRWHSLAAFASSSLPPASPGFSESIDRRRGRAAPRHRRDRGPRGGLTVLEKRMVYPFGPADVALNLNDPPLPPKASNGCERVQWSDVIKTELRCRLIGVACLVCLPTLSWRKRSLALTLPPVYLTVTRFLLTPAAVLRLRTHVPPPRRPLAPQGDPLASDGAASDALLGIIHDDGDAPTPGARTSSSAVAPASPPPPAGAAGAAGTREATGAGDGGEASDGAEAVTMEGIAGTVTAYDDVHPDYVNGVC